MTIYSYPSLWKFSSHHRNRPHCLTVVVLDTFQVKNVNTWGVITKRTRMYTDILYILAYFSQFGCTNSEGCACMSFESSMTVAMLTSRQTYNNMVQAVCYARMHEVPLSANSFFFIVTISRNTFFLWCLHCNSLRLLTDGKVKVTSAYYSISPFHSRLYNFLKWYSNIGDVMDITKLVSSIYTRRP